MDNEADVAVRRYRDANDHALRDVPQNAARTEFTNPGPGSVVRAEDFLSHLDLDLPEVNAVLKDAYPSLGVRPDLKPTLQARLRFLAWMTLEGYAQVAGAHRHLKQHPEVAQRLGLDPLPAYDTMRECLNDRLGEARLPMLKAALLREEKRLLPTLGEDASEDATPLVARRRDEEAPYHPHYKARMRKLELRWDGPHEALLADQYAPGTSDEEPYLRILSDRLEASGIHAHTLWVDNGYTSFQTHAHEARHGTRLVHKPQDSWVVDANAARLEVETRFQHHWRDEAFPLEGSWQAKVNFIINHGSDLDRDAVGRWLRDDALTRRTPEEAATLRERRSQNEALNAEGKRMPLDPPRRGARCQYQRVLACTLTMHLVQLTRLQHGVTTHLCRTTHIV